ncbi:MAG: hypothetical protein PHI06_03980 [Desulfobulbaceae bacterium]|nr:hypothetical protein [Desulfobulbaceae bacterium]
MPKSIVLILLALVACTACVKQIAQPEDTTLPSQVKSIIVLPVAIAADTNVTTPESKKGLQKGTEAMDQILGEYFTDNDKVRLLSAVEVDSFSPGYSSTQSGQAQFIGKALHSEAVMLWELQRYIERSGTNYAVQNPASVAFTYRLIHTESGQTLCAGTFDETQQSATENLLSFKKIANRGFKWIPAATLAKEGVTKKLPACTYLFETEK